MVPILDSAKSNHCQFHVMPLREREHTLQTIRIKEGKPIVYFPKAPCIIDKTLLPDLCFRTNIVLRKLVHSLCLLESN